MNPAVIGGGYAGMAAAVTLAHHGIPATVLESARQLGGRARGVLHNDTQLDNGQHILLGCYRHTLHLIELVGGNVAEDFLHLPLQLTLHRRFELKAPRLPAPLHLLVGLLTARGLGIKQCLSAARFMLAMRRARFKLPSHIHGRGGGGEGDVPVLQLLQAYGQDTELIRLLWEPICISALNTPVHKASAQVLLNVLRDSLNGSRADSDMLLPRLDFSTLFPDRAATYLEQQGGQVLRSCTVESIQPLKHGIELGTSQGAMRFSQVICAASPANSARLFGVVPELAGMAAQIAAIPYQPIFTVYLQYPPHITLPQHPQGVRRWVPGGSAATLPQSMLGLDRCYTQWLFDKGLIAGQAGLIAAVISAEGAHQELPHELLAQKVAQELRDHLGINEQPLWHKVIAEKRATFACEVGLQRPQHATPVPGLWLAGDYTANDYPATLEGAVISGIAAATQLLQHA